MTTATALPRLELPELVVETGRRARLTTHVDGDSLLQPRIRWTENVDEFRSWMSVRGDRFQDGRAAVPPEFLPCAAWKRGSTFTVEDLTPDEHDDLKRAASIYIFGHRPLVEGFRAAIERRYAPFAAAFYRAERIEVESAAVLTVDGYPAVLELEELTVRSGGNLTLLTPFKLSTRRLYA